MRIRKNAAKFSQLSTPSSPSSNTLIKKNQYLNCVLNQSPWDIITFSPPNYSDSPDSPLLHFQVDEDFGFARNGSFVDSIGAIRSPGPIETCMESEEMLKNNDDDKGPDFSVAADAGSSRVGFDCIELKEEEKIDKFEVGGIVLCRETNGKGWQCGKMVKDGHKMCGRHLKSCSTSASTNTNSKKKSDGDGTRRGRGRPRIKKKEPAAAPAPAQAQEDSSPFEYYYYSGFGPQWGKKKLGPVRTNNGNGTDDQLGSSVPKNEDRTTAKTSVAKPDIDYMECDDDDDEDDDDGGASGKKRGRKRIKARSLKSLM